MWVKNFYFSVKCYTQILHRQKSSKGSYSVNTLPLCELWAGMWRGLEGKSYQYDSASLVPVRQAHILKSQRDCAGFGLRL